MRQFLRRAIALLCLVALLSPAALALSVEEARFLLETYYVDPLPSEAEQAEDLESLLASLGDPYTYYMTPQELEAFYGQVEGESSVTGIGLSVQASQDGIRIVSVLPGGGAQAAGLAAGDCITAIDGVSCVPADSSHLALLTGPEGSFVTVTVLRSDGSTICRTIRRQVVEIRNTNVSLLENGVGRIDCDSFGTRTAALFREGVTTYDSQVHLWIVDLRDNAGGLSQATVEAAGLFTGPGALMCYQDRNGYITKETVSTPAISDRPVIVLTNSSSASASEVFAAAIRDTGRGILIGERTYGKGTAQILLDEEAYPNLFQGDALRVTAYRFFSPDAVTNDRVGVLPTLLLPAGYAQDAACLLSAPEPSQPSGYLALELNGLRFYIDLQKAHEKESVFRTLLAALPADTPLWRGTAQGWESLSPAKALEDYQADSISPWFKDVADSPYADSINTLAGYHILQGMGRGQFAPASTITRAQVCALLSQALGLVYYGGGPFSDVPDGAWYAPSVNAMAALGLVNGMGQGTFCPNAPMSNQEYITLMARLAGFLNFRLAQFLPLTEDMETDPALSAWAAWAVPSAKLLTSPMAEGIGLADSMLYAPLADIPPTAPILREEAAATLCYVLQGAGVLAY